VTLYLFIAYASCLILFSRQLKYIGKQGDVRFFMRTIPYGFADACGIASSENHPSKFPRKLAWEVEERARGKHANPKELCENPNIYYRTSFFRKTDQKTL